MEDYITFFSGKRITVMGLGLLGRGLNDTLFLVKCGAKVTVTDLKTPEQLAPSLEKLRDLPIKVKLAGHDPADFVETDMVLRNADVPKSSPYIKLAREHGISVEMDESLFCKHFKGMTIGITGTRGKTTTTEMAFRVLKRVKPNTFLAGNIMGRATLPLLQDVTSKDTVIMELSSWQLQGFHEAKISPHASVFTNIYPDHMNRYSGMEEYVSDKKAIYMYQKAHDFCLFNGDQEATRTLYESAPAQKYFFSYSDIPINLDLKIPGEHNISNVAAMWRLANKLGIEDRIIREVVENFQGVEHRLESLGSKGGIRFINDSTSTTPVAGIMALRSIKAENIFLIAGGADKKLDLKPFAEEASRRAQKIALLEGTATSALYSDLASLGAESKIVGIFDNLERAVLYLYNQASSGDVILLSPACASFGLFNNEFHRGDCFKSVVKGILSS